MIVTVTPNPSVDRTLFIDALARGQVTRSKRSLAEPSGKGVNVSLALHAHRHPTTAVLPIGGASGAQLAQMLTSSGVAFRPVPVSGVIRSNISLAESDGTVTKINESGPSLTSGEVRALQDAALAASGGATWLAVCGSLPGGVGADFYTGLVRSARDLGLKAALDTSGVALGWAVQARPDLVKPNAEELAEAAGRALATLGDAVEAAQHLRREGARAVLASLGADGAILVDSDGVVHGEAPVARPVSTVGAGDALLAGFLAAGGTGPAALANGLQWAAAAVQQAGTVLATSDGSAQVTLHDRADLARVLRNPH
ncbi:MAG TPA: 1-phosphofructokinase family hexose kinase [Trebonia sp.]